MSRRERRAAERAYKRAAKAIEKGNSPTIAVHMGIGFKVGYRLIRDGRVVQSYGVEEGKDDN